MNAAIKAVVQCTAVVVLLATTAVAQRGQKGSLMVFPDYGREPGVLSVVTVTNANPTTATRVHFAFTDGATCETIDLDVDLLPADTYSFVSAATTPGVFEGFLVVHAIDPSGEPIVFNDLLGWSGRYTVFLPDIADIAVEPYVFRGIGDGVQTDVDQDGRLELDGIEYQEAWDRLHYPRFLGQGPDYQSELTLIALNGDPSAETDVGFLLYNDSGTVFSNSFTFAGCWTREPLSTFSPIFLNANLATTPGNDPAEFVAPGREAGWFTLDGLEARRPSGAVLSDNPAVLALLSERAVASGRAAVVLPFGWGTTDQGVIGNDTDCNDNGVPDADDIASGTSTDINGNGVPDDCEFDPPACPDGVTLDLWPPNHSYSTVDLAAAAGVVDPQGFDLGIVITAITQDEPVNANGDGNTVCDGTGVGGDVASIRAERQGGGNGRVYAIHYTATSIVNLSCDGVLTVTVPHSQNGTPATDDGQNHDSTEGCQ